MVMFDFVIKGTKGGEAAIDSPYHVRCSTVGCNSVIDNSNGIGFTNNTYCNFCVRDANPQGNAWAQQPNPTSNTQIKPHYKWDWKLDKAVRV